MHGRRPPTAVDFNEDGDSSERDQAGDPGCPSGPERPEPRAGGAAGEGAHAHRGDRRAEPGALARGDGRRHRLRHPRGRDPPGLRPAARLGQGAPHPGAPRAGCRPRGRGVRRCHRTRRRLHGDLRPGRDQPRHAARRRAHGLRADRRHHRPGHVGRHRHRRLPGGRHPRHHDADHQAQLPGDQRRRHPPHHRRGVPHRRHRPPRPGARRHLQGRPAGAHHVLLAAAHRPARLPPGHPPAQQADPRGRPADRRGQAAHPLRRWRRHPGPRQRGAAALRRAEPDPRGHHADGPRRAARQPPAAPRDAGHARLGLGRHRPAEVRPDHRPRRPLRRPGHRPAQDLRARRQGHPRRHRPRRDQQEPQGRRADRR